MLKILRLFSTRDDSNYEGKELRLIQEYFMTSAGLQTIIKSYLKQGLPLERIHEKFLFISMIPIQQ